MSGQWAQPEWESYIQEGDIQARIPTERQERERPPELRARQGCGGRGPAGPSLGITEGTARTRMHLRRRQGLTVDGEGAGGRLARSQPVGDLAPVGARVFDLQRLQPQCPAIVLEVLVIPVKPGVVYHRRVGITLTSQGCLPPLHHSVPWGERHAQPPGCICKGKSSQGLCSRAPTPLHSQPLVPATHTALGVSGSLTWSLRWSY